MHKYCRVVYKAVRFKGYNWVFHPYGWMTSRTVRRILSYGGTVLCIVGAASPSLQVAGVTVVGMTKKSAPANFHNVSMGAVQSLFSASALSALLF